MPMTFIWPVMLLFLLALPLFAWLYLRIQRQRRRVTASWGSMGTMQNTARPGFRRHIPPLLFVLAVAILIVALARPETMVNLPRIEGTVILAFDVSGSMAADDLKPTRMDAAKAAAQDFVERQPNTVQIGVVAFSDSGISVQPPTNDQGTILGAINRLTPQRGTSLGSGILASLTAITAKPQSMYSKLTPSPTPEVTSTAVAPGSFTSAAVVLLTDGENNEAPDPMTAAQSAVDRGVRIYTVGIGSPQGTTLKVNGFTVHTQLDESTLTQIAQLTGGTYYNAESSQDLLSIYDHLDPQLVIKPQKTEITSLFAGASILVLLIGGLFSLVWFSRLP